MGVRTYLMGQGESRPFTVEFEELLPAGVTISNPAVSFQDFATGADVAAGLTATLLSVAGTDVTGVLTVAEDLAAGVYGIIVEVEGSDGGEYQSRDAGDYPIKLVVRT